MSFFGGYDLLLDEIDGKFMFKLTEMNIACPTGLSFFDSANHYYKLSQLAKNSKQSFNEEFIEQNFQQIPLTECGKTILEKLL